MKKLIFFVEDDPATVEVYETALKANGFAVEIFTSGEEVLERMKQINGAQKPDLILLDFILPELDGLQVVREIRKNKKTKDIKIFITTNYSIEELKAKGKFVDGEKFILKADYPPTRMIELIKKELRP